MPSFFEISPPVLEEKNFEGQVVSEEKMFEYYGNIHVYCHGVGAYELLRKKKTSNYDQSKL